MQRHAEAALWLLVHGVVFASFPPVRIEVIAEDGTTLRTARTYAEYRLFATLARYARLIRSVHVALRPLQRQDNADRVTCAVEVSLEPCGSVRVRADGRHPRGAIDRAAARLAHLLDNSLPPTGAP